MTDFLAMGGYGAFVWPSYALALLVLGLNAWLPWRRHRALQRQRQSDPKP
jgi:heme exporter protein D